MYVNKKPLLFSIMLLLGMVYMSENVAGDGTIAVGMMPLYVARGDTPFAVRFAVTGLMPHTDYTYTARIHRPGGTYGSFWSDNSGKEAPGWRTAYSTLGNTGEGTSLSTWAHVRAGTSVSAGNAVLRLRVRVKTSSGSPTPTDFPLIVMDASSAGWFRNSRTTGYVGGNVVEVRDGGGILMGLVLSEPNGVDDDGSGVVDDEDYGPLGNTGDFRVAVPSGMSLTTTIDGNLYAPTEIVNAGRDKDIPAIFHSIEQAKELSDGSYVHVSGVVTAPKGVFSKSEAYIQDAIAGIRICKSNGMPNLSLGDRVDVSGIMCEKKNEREIQISMAWRESSGNMPPPPHIALTADSMCEENEGLLLEIFHATVTSTGKSAFILDDGSGSARISLYPSTGISTKRYAGFGVGAVVRVVGIAGQIDDAHELKPRFLSDITVLIPAPIPRPPYNLPQIVAAMAQTTHTNIVKAERLKSAAAQLLSKAEKRGLDVSGCDPMFYEAERLLSKAHKMSQGNPIASNNFALRAIEILEEVIRCLVAVLGS